MGGFIMGSTKTKWRGNQLAFYDGTTYETVKPIAPIILYDDFLGTVINTDIWTDLDVANGTTTAPALSVFNLTCGVQNENQAAGCYGKDDKTWNIDKGLIFEARLNFAVAPAGLVEVHVGVIADSYGADSMAVAAADEMSKYCLFVFDGDLVAKIYADDDTAVNRNVATGVTISGTAYTILRIDFTNSADVKFYIDGVGVATGTTFKMNTVAALMVQPWIMLYKKTGGGTDAGTVNLDYVKIWQATR
jgi:hypothetical protein